MCGICKGQQDTIKRVKRWGGSTQKSWCTGDRYKKVLRIFRRTFFWRRKLLFENLGGFEHVSRNRDVEGATLFAGTALYAQIRLKNLVTNRIRAFGTGAMAAIYAAGSFADAEKNVTQVQR